MHSSTESNIFIDEVLCRIEGIYMNVVSSKPNYNYTDLKEEKLTSVVRVSGHVIVTPSCDPVGANRYKTESQILQRYMLSRGLDQLFMSEEVRDALSKVTGYDKIAIDITLRDGTDISQFQKVLDKTSGKLIFTDTQNNRVIAEICSVTAVALKKSNLVEYFNKVAIV